MLGTIAIILVIFTVLIFPVTFMSSRWIDRHLSTKSLRFIEFLVYLIPLYSLIIVILGHKSKNANEGYGLWLNISMGVGYLVIASVIIFILFILYKLFTEGLNLGGIR